MNRRNREHRRIHAAENTSTRAARRTDKKEAAHRKIDARLPYGFTPQIRD